MSALRGLQGLALGALIGMGASGCAPAPSPTPKPKAGVLAELSPEAAAQLAQKLDPPTPASAEAPAASAAEELVLAHLRGDAATVARRMASSVKLEGAVMKEATPGALEARLQAFYRSRAQLGKLGGAGGGTDKPDRRVSRKDVDAQFGASVVLGQVAKIARDLGLPPPGEKEVSVEGILLGGRLYLVVSLAGRPVAITSQNTPRGM